jgi:hydroxypyruvate reductase
MPVPSPLRERLIGVYDAAVQAALPAKSLIPRLPPMPKGRLILLAAGKAAGSMTPAAERHYLDTLGVDPARLAGVAVARHGYGAPTQVIPMLEAGHPVPDAASQEAAEQALALAAEAGPDDLVLVLLSGGGSANWIAPAPGLTLADKQAVTRALLRSGAAIDEINTVRKRLSRIKGGRLALAAHPAPVVTLAVSDVPGDDPAIIASGPTVADASSNADARGVIAKYNISLPPAALALLSDPAMETPKPGDPRLAHNRFEIIARPLAAIAAAEAACVALGYEAMVLGPDVEGEARAVAADQAALALKLKAEGRRAAIISGGELTVTIRGQGRGGPNQEYALALAIALEGAAGIAAIAGDTDGTDGGGGAASDPAGALIDAGTLQRAAALGLDAAGRLADNDSTGFFSPLGDLLTPGPTLTNVNDCRVILIDPL